MHYITGVYEKFEKDLWIGKKNCPNCGQSTDFYLMRKIRCGTAFFIPIMTLTAGRYIKCDNCGRMEDIKRKDFNIIRGERERIMENGDFPKEIIREDFSPDVLKFHWRVVKLIFALLWLLICGIGMVGTLMDMPTVRTAEDFFSALVFIAVDLLIALPAVFSVRTFVREYKKRKAYKKVMI